MRLRPLTQAVMATAFAVATSLTGLAGPAQALVLDIESGDLMLALWNNSTEYLQDLGPASSLFGSTHSISIPSSVLSAVNPAGGSPLKFSIYGIQFDTTS